MGEKEPKSKESPFGAVIERIIDLIAGFQLFFQEAKHSVQSHLDWFLRRIEYIFMVYLWVSIGLVFLILGAFDLVIDLGGVPRGWVFSIGGLFIFLIAIVFLQAAKIKKK